MALKKPKPSPVTYASHPSSPTDKVSKARTKAPTNARKKDRPKKPGADAAGRALTNRRDAPCVPAFLTPRQFKKLAEMTRRRRISQARTKVSVAKGAGRPRAVAARGARPPAAKRKVWDYRFGFDPQDDD